jgi:hypothetical protein
MLKLKFLGQPFYSNDLEMFMYLFSLGHFYFSLMFFRSIKNGEVTSLDVACNLTGLYCLMLNVYVLFPTL